MSCKPSGLHTSQNTALHRDCEVSEIVCPVCHKDDTDDQECTVCHEDDTTTGNATCVMNITQIPRYCRAHRLCPDCLVSEFECPVCHEDYTEHKECPMCDECFTNPKILPCSTHSVLTAWSVSLSVRSQETAVHTDSDLTVWSSSLSVRFVARITQSTRSARCETSISRNQNSCHASTHSDSVLTASGQRV